jgi:hypothetical protein
VTVVRKRIFRPLTVGALLILAIPIGYAGFLYLSYIDATTTSGSGYGFTIGQAKADAYRVAQAQFRSGDIEAIDTLRNREEEIKRFPDIVNSSAGHKVSEIRDSFERWDQWSLWLQGEPRALLVVLNFQGDRLQGLDLSRPGHPGDLGVRVGQSYAEVYSALESLAALPEYASLVVDTGWMARRQPVSLSDSEYRFVAEQDEWTLKVNGTYLNAIRLSFHDGRLVRIHRHRQYFELP